MDDRLAEAFAEILDEVWTQPWLGNATTGELLNELRVRAQVNGTLGYRTVETDEERESRTRALLMAAPVERSQMLVDWLHDLRRRCQSEESFIECVAEQMARQKQWIDEVLRAEGDPRRLPLEIGEQEARG